MLSHTLLAFITTRGGALAEPTADSADRAQRVCLEIKKRKTAAAAFGAQFGLVRRGARTTGVNRDGPVSVECREQDRCEGPCVGAGAFPCGAAKARLCRP